MILPKSKYMYSFTPKMLARVNCGNEVIYPLAAARFSVQKYVCSKFPELLRAFKCASRSIKIRQKYVGTK